jgi:AraC-like DNA-binding protein
MEGPKVRVGNVEHMPDLLRSLGLDVAELFAIAGIDADAFDEPQAFIPLAALDELFFQAEVRSGCDHVGFLLGRLTTDFGLPVYLLYHAPSLRAGLRDVTALYALLHQGGGVALSERAGVATLRYSTIASALRCAHHATDCVITQAQTVLSRCCGAGFAPLEVRLPRSAPSNVAMYVAHFGGVTPVFDAADASIDFPAFYLARASEKADTKLYAFLRMQLAAFSDPLKEPLRARVMRALGTSITDRDLTQQRVARLLDMPLTDLRRQLKAEQTNLSALIREARDGAAIQMVEHTGLSLTEIAAMLHYSDSSALSRQFKRRTGQTPTEWRNARQSARSAIGTRPGKSCAQQNPGSELRRRLPLRVLRLVDPGDQQFPDRRQHDRPQEQARDPVRHGAADHAHEDHEHRR